MSVSGPPMQLESFQPVAGIGLRYWKPVTRSFSGVAHAVACFTPSDEMTLSKKCQK